MRRSGPNVVVFSSLFPSGVPPSAGVFIRERMFRVGQVLPIAVISPRPWFPLQGLLRRWRPHFRPEVSGYESQQGIEIYRPRFFSVPGFLKRFDGLLMAVGALPTLWRLRRAGRLELLDAHFAYPDGYAASLIGRWLGLPVTITLRGTEARHAADPVLAPYVRKALEKATRVFTVSDSLKRVAVSLGIPAEGIRVIGNGVDIGKFHCVDRGEARRHLRLPKDAKVLISVGGLVERKGFHRVIECLPALLERFPSLHYVIVGGPSPEGDWSDRLRRQVHTLGLADRVHFTGPMPPEELKGPLSAADVFVLATRNEGWANVFLEAMACGLPVVTTNVGGNAEVVCRPQLGTLVPFGDRTALEEALANALRRDWDRNQIVAHALSQSWEDRVRVLVDEFREIAATKGRAASSTRQLEQI